MKSLHKLVYDKLIIGKSVRSGTPLQEVLVEYYSGKNNIEQIEAEVINTLKSAASSLNEKNLALDTMLALKDRERGL